MPMTCSSQNNTLYAPFVDDELDRKWRRSEEELPEEYLMKCRKLFVEKPNCDVQCLLSKGVVLLTNSCRSSNDGVHSTCLKLLHLANLFYNRFRKIVVENQQLVIKGFCSFFISIS